jgi:serine/threonine protein kinase
VIEAINQKNKQKVAIKKIAKIFSNSETFQKRILRELQILKHLRSNENVKNIK